MTFNELTAIFQGDYLDHDVELVFSTNDDPTDEFIIDDVIDEGTVIRIFLVGR